MLDELVAEVSTRTKIAEAELLTELKDGENWIEGAEKVLLGKLDEVAKADSDKRVLSKEKQTTRLVNLKWEKGLKPFGFEYSGPESINELDPFLNGLKSSVELDEEALKGNPIVQGMLVEAGKKAGNEEVLKYKTAITAKEEEIAKVTKEFDAFKSTTIQSKKKSDWKAWATKGLAHVKADLGDKPETIEKRTNTFVRSISLSTLGHDDDGEMIPLDKNGEHLENPTTFKPYTMLEFIADNQPYNILKQDPNAGSAGAKSSGANKKEEIEVPKGATISSLNEALKTERDPAKKKVLIVQIKQLHNRK